MRRHPRRRRRRARFLPLGAALIRASPAGLLRMRRRGQRPQGARTTRNAVQ